MRVAGYALGMMLGMTAVASAAPVRVNLRTELDSRWSKAGDPVTATLEAPLQSGSLVLAKGTVVLGHVQQVTKKDARGHAEIGLLFDHAALPGGRTVPIAVKIVAASASPYQRIPDCDSPGLEEESSLQVMTRNCHGPLLYRIARRQDGTSGTLLKGAPERGPWRESWLAGPITLQKGTQMDVEIVPVS